MCAALGVENTSALHRGRTRKKERKKRHLLFNKLEQQHSIVSWTFILIKSYYTKYLWFWFCRFLAFLECLQCSLCHSFKQWTDLSVSVSRHCTSIQGKFNLKTLVVYVVPRKSCSWAMYLLSFYAEIWLWFPRLWWLLRSGDFCDLQSLQKVSSTIWR